MLYILTGAILLEVIGRLTVESISSIGACSRVRPEGRGQCPNLVWLWAVEWPIPGGALHPRVAPVRQAVLFNVAVTSLPRAGAMRAY